MMMGAGNVRRIFSICGVLIPLSVILLWTGISPASAGQPITNDFPRLAMWWPSNDQQSVADRARYDWVEMQWHDADHIAEMRAANPDVVLLTSNSGRELNFNSDYDNWTNVELRSASTDWLMTQVGSTLSAPISATATNIPVADVSRFAVNDLVLVDHELMSVISLGVSNLTVASRGVPMPAVTHAAGARVAATISCWPGALEFDVTVNCPRVDVGYGPETWNDWNVRRGVRAVAAADWDGVMIDCNDGSPSWWTNSYARSIDENRDNIPDDLTALDNSWNIGMAAYGTALKAAVGSDVIVAGNYAVTNFNINGRNWEGFPNTGTTSAIWHQQVLGPYNTQTTSSYLEWVTNAHQPNITTIQTYEYDGDIPAGSGWNDPGNLYSGFPPAGFVPNYQKMRYGLTTALLGDGYFAYELTTQGHAVRALFWFDEFDNAGAGRGYLGQPLAPAVNVFGNKSDLMAGTGSFDSLAQLNTWTLSLDSPIIATKTNDAGSARIDITTPDQIWQLGFQHTASFVAGKTYEITFRAKSSSIYENLSGMIWDGTGSNYTNGRFGTTNTGWNSYRTTIDVAHSGSGYFRLYFGNFRGSMWFDDIRVRETSPEVWRRDYANGISIVNAEATAQTLQLGGTFRKIRGTQVPTVNDGSLVTQITLQPKDGIVLLRETPAVSYTLTYVAGSGGTLSGTAIQTVPGGGNGTAVTAVPSTGYHFVNWSDGVASSSRTDANVLTNGSFMASFTIDIYTNTYALTYTAGPNGTISGASPQTVNYNGSGMAVTAVPNIGYHFVAWSDGGLDAVRQDMNVTANHTISATFAADTVVPPAKTHTTLSFKSSPYTSYRGHKFVFSGKISPSSMASGTRITVWMRKSGHEWCKLGTVYTNGYDNYSYTLYNGSRAHGKYYVRVKYAGNSAYLPSYSAYKTVYIR